MGRLGRKGVVALTGVALVAGALAVFSPTQAQQPPQPAAGRYQLIVDKDGPPRYLFEPGGGKVWKADKKAGWGDALYWLPHLAESPPK